MTPSKPRKQYTPEFKAQAIGGPPVLGLPWIRDIDVTVKPLYGR